MIKTYRERLRGELFAFLFLFGIIL